MIACTSYESPRVVVCSHNGRRAAVGMGTAIVMGADFGDAVETEELRDIRIEEVLLPTTDASFPFWNGLVGKRIDPTTFCEVSNGRRNT